MSEGKAVEFDSPAKLLEKKGLFYDMVQQSGEKEQLEKIIRAG
jgi:ABC-type multidrug transport system fused ATPase/permease subunit